MCKAMEDMRNETEEQTKTNIACKLINSGKLSLEEIAQNTKLALDKVKELASPTIAQ